MVEKKEYKNKKYRKIHFSLFDLVNVILMMILSLLFLYPFWHQVVVSFSTDAYAAKSGLKLWPEEWTLDAYRYVFADKSLWLGYKNTIWRTVVGTVTSVIATYCAGYAMARKNLPFRRAISIYMLIPMLFGGGLIPTYLVMKAYGLVGSRWALILPGLASTWNIMVTRNYVAGLPQELEEAAIADGARPMRIAFQIMLPLSKPVIAVLALWNAVGHWNAWFDAMIYCTGDESVVLQTVLRRLLNQAATVAEQSQVFSSLNIVGESIKGATIMVAIVPIICVYPFIQKYFAKGVTLGAVKG